MTTVNESATRRKVSLLRWMSRAPAERMTLPGAALVFAAAGMLHGEQIPAIDPATGTLAVAAVAALGMKNRRHGRQAAAALTTAGGWLTLATHTGPLSGPDHATAWLWAGLSVTGYVALRNHSAVRSRRELRKAKHAWREWRAASYGLEHSHLLDWERTRLGEAFDVDTRETGRRASHLANAGDLAELIAEREMLPPTRVQVQRGKIAGRIRISIRYIDPWAHAPLHPVLDPKAEIDLPVPSTIRDPVCVGQDPETGAQLTIPLWSKAGAKNILVVAMQGGGKSVLLSNIRERVTASTDGIVWDINLSKAHEDLEWSQACDLIAATQAERAEAARILRLARGVIDYRGAQPRETANFVPSPDDPLIIVIIDEIDTLVDANDKWAAQIKDDLKYIASKSRSEGVALVLAGQRATAEWIGGNNVRTQIDLVCLGKVNRAGEARHAAGEIGLSLPDMATYGEGAEGVWVITDFSGNWRAGRTFDLEEPADLRQLASDRAASRPTLPTGLVAYLGDYYQALKRRQAAASAPLPQATAAAGSGGSETPPPDSGGATSVDVLDKPEPGDDLGGLDFDMPDDLQRQLRDLDAKIGGTRKVQYEIGQIGLPDVSAEQATAAAERAWRQILDDLPGKDRAQVKMPRLLAIVEDGGTTTRAAAEHLGETAWTVRCWLEALRAAGLVHVEGKGRGARWRSGPADTETSAGT